MTQPPCSICCPSRPHWTSSPSSSPVQFSSVHKAYSPGGFCSWISVQINWGSLYSLLSFSKLPVSATLGAVVFPVISLSQRANKVFRFSLVVIFWWWLLSSLHVHPGGYYYFLRQFPLFLGRGYRDGRTCWCRLSYTILKWGCLYSSRWKEIISYHTMKCNTNRADNGL